MDFAKDACKNIYSAILNVKMDKHIILGQI